jgi:flagellar protein FlgJ
MSVHDLSARFALDVGSVEALKRQARSEPDKALRAVSSQFEALLMQMMLKSMREAAESAGSSDSQDTRMYKSMLDQQLSIALAKRGIGLSDVMVRQLGRAGAAETPALDAPAAATQTPGEKIEGLHGADDVLPAPLHVPMRRRQPAPSPAGSGLPVGAAAGAAGAAVSQPAGGLPDSARNFVNRVWPHALEASRTTGVAPHFILGQAALESGWGRAEIRLSDGSPSHNLFGIKAGRGWQGPTAEVVTTEYVNGAPVKSVERFRAYASYTEAFRDYANLLASNPRYAGVLNERTDAAAFARGLQRAGYATDPNYADKLTRVITGTLMRAGLSG